MTTIPPCRLRHKDDRYDTVYAAVAVESAFRYRLGGLPAVVHDR